MHTTQDISNDDNIQHALDYLALVIKARIKIHFATNKKDRQENIPTLAYVDDGSTFGEFIKAYAPTFEEYIIILLALAHHIRPQFLNNTIKEALPDSGDFTEIGGTRDADGRGFIATGETALFVLAGSDLKRRFETLQLLTASHWFNDKNILKLESPKTGQSMVSGKLLLNPDYVELFTLGYVASPHFSEVFPAQELKTELEWDELILSDEVLNQVNEIKQWVEHSDTLLNEWGMVRKLNPGYKALFYGSPGTGKTLTASLLGKFTQRQVYRVDLSSVVSKYVGETEKNLSSLFNKAKDRDWILFFDEADALFGKRTSVKESHDRYANQEVSFLLQKLEEFEGLVILASNFKSNMDDAFLRRFNSIINFSFPEIAQRCEIWQKSFPELVSFERGADFPGLLGQFELAGGSIINVVQYCCLKSIARGPDKLITMQDALDGIKKELDKEGKVFKNVIEKQWAKVILAEKAVA